MELQHPILSSRIAGKGNNYSNNDRLCSRIGLTESSNMLPYSNASSREKNRQYLVINGGACLVALASRGRQQCSRPGHQQRRQSRCLPERRGGRNNEYNANICITRHDMSRSEARRALTWYKVVLVKGEPSGKVFPVFRVFGQMNRRGKVMCSLCQGCVADERAAYPDSSRRSEQLSC